MRTAADLSAVLTERNGARLYHDSIENSSSGAFGDPSEVSAEKGRPLFEAATGQLVEPCEGRDAHQWETLGPRDHIRGRALG